MEKASRGGCELSPGVIVCLREYGTDGREVPFRNQEFSLGEANDLQMRVLLENDAHGLFLDGKGRVVEPRDYARDQGKKIYKFIKKVSLDQREGFSVTDCGSTFYLVGREYHGMMEEIKIEKIEGQFNKFKIFLDAGRPLPKSMADLSAA